MAEGEEEGGGARMKPNELRKVVVGVCVMEKKVGKTGETQTQKQRWVGMGLDGRGEEFGVYVKGDWVRVVIRTRWLCDSFSVEIWKLECVGDV
jgi:hypothetical protein